MTENAHICEKCGERLTEEQLICETDPNLWKHPMREICLKIREQNGEPVPEAQSYHQRWTYSHINRRNERYLCGPTHVETEQEYFIHWIGYGMKSDTSSY